MLDWLHKKRPLEVYVAALVIYFLLFLNAAELLAARTHMDELFSLERSIIYDLFRGIGDDNLGYQQAQLLSWILSLLYVVIVLLKARSISNWIWSDTHFQPKDRAK